MKKKKPTRSQLVKRLDNLFSEYIRRRNTDFRGTTKCFTCGKEEHWKKLQCGHFQSRKHYATRWHETNCQVQCAACNVFRYGEQYKFGLNLDNEFGEGIAEELLNLSKNIVKLSNVDLLDKIDYYKNKIKLLE